LSNVSDQLGFYLIAALQRYSTCESFQKAVSLGRYSKVDRTLLSDIFDAIQSIDLNTEQLAVLPAVGDLAPEWGWWGWLWPPVRNNSQEQPAFATPTAAAAAAAEFVPAVDPAAAAAATAGDGRPAVQRQRMPSSSDGIPRNFTTYTAATPVDLGRGRFILSLTTGLKGAVPDDSGLAECKFRMWVCAVDPQQYRAGLQQPDAAEGAQGLFDGADDMLWSVNDLEGFAGVAASIDQDQEPEGLAVLHTSGSAAAVNGMAGAATATEHPSCSSPFHPSHVRRELILFRKKSSGNAGGAASGSQGRASQQLLVDASVGWCVLEPGREAKTGWQPKRSRWVGLCLCVDDVEGREVAVHHSDSNLPEPCFRAPTVHV
jgi:hypothetical protein